MKKMTRLAAAILCAAFVTTFVSCANAADSSSPTEKTSKDDKKPENEGELPPEDQGPVTYKVNISTSIENGSVTASPESAAEGTEITLTATPASGYVWSSYTVTGAGGAAVSVSAQGKFTMPASDVTVSATFVVGVNASLSNFASIVQNLTQDSTIAMTGQLTSGDLATIKSALQTLTPSQPKIKLDLRGVTGLDSLPQGALDGCPNLQSLSLPEGLASIDPNALTGCENLESLYLPASFRSFDGAAFELSSVFTSINIAEGNLVYSSVDGVLFSKDKKTLLKCPKGKSGDYTVPDGVTVIGDMAFTACGLLTSISLPDTLQEICSYAFSRTAISSIIIPSSVVTISNLIFDGNDNLSSLTFRDADNWIATESPDNYRIRSGGDNANFVSDGSSNVTVYNKNYFYYKTVSVSDNVTAFVQTVSDLTQDGTVNLEGQIKQTDLGAIYNAIKTAKKKVKLDMSGVSGLTSLPERAFQSCMHLQEIILPEGITSIGRSAFSGCGDLESVTIPATVTNLGNDALGSDMLLRINVSEGNSFYSSIDGVLFSKDKKTLILCPKGKTGTYVIPDGVKVIGQEAFANSRLTGVTITNGVERLERGAFISAKLTSLVLPTSIISIGGCAFQDCNQIPSVIIPNSVTSIESSAFYSCDSLGSVVISASVNSISNYVFYNCNALNSLTFEDPNGWIRADYSQWMQRSGGDDAEFIVSGENPPPQNPSQIASWFKTEYASSYWYKTTQN